VVDRRVSTSRRRDGERALVALRLHEGRFRADVDALGGAADFDRLVAERDTVAAGDCTPVRRASNPSIVTSTV
jgi:hypothetical protein